MKVYDIHDNAGRVFAFEIGNFGIGRHGVCRIARTIPGAVVVRQPKFLSWWRESEFCEFIVDGELFVAEEPWGDKRRSIQGDCGEVEQLARRDPARETPARLATVRRPPVSVDVRGRQLARRYTNGC